MTAGKFNFVMEQGADFKWGIVWKVAPSLTPVILSGYRARMQIRQIPGAEILLELTTENGRIALRDNGLVEIRTVARDTAALDFHRAKYDLELISAGGEVTRLLEGSMKLKKEITA